MSGSGDACIADVDFTNVDNHEHFRTDDVIYENCDFSGCYFEASKLSNVSFIKCNLRRALLNKTKHFYTAFVDCDLAGADFYFAELYSTTFTNSPLDDTHLLHAIVPATTQLPPGYTTCYQASADLGSLLDLVVYDHAWLINLPKETGASEQSVATLLSEHPRATPRELFALLKALST